TGAYRRLTRLDRVIPEFFWNHDFTKIIWGIGGATDAYVAFFPGIPPVQRKIPERTLAALYGVRGDKSRVGSQAQPIRRPGPPASVPGAAQLPAAPAPAFPHASHTGDRIGVANVIATYLPRWLDDLEALGEAAAVTLTVDPPKRLGLGG